jgi:hypothetical protein
MLIPRMTARVEKGFDSTRHRVDAGEVRTLVQVALRARQGKVLGLPQQRYENSHSDFEIRCIHRELRQIGVPKSEPRSGSKIWEIPLGSNLRNVRGPVRHEPIRQGFSTLRTKENTGLIASTRMVTLFSGFNSILSGSL